MVTVIWGNADAVCETVIAVTKQCPLTVSEILACHNSVSRMLGVCAAPTWPVIRLNPLNRLN